MNRDNIYLYKGTSKQRLTYTVDSIGLQCITLRASAVEGAELVNTAMLALCGVQALINIWRGD